jgi:hypothetical protein
MVEDGLLTEIEDVAEINQDMGEIAAIIWAGRR